MASKKSAKDFPYTPKPMEERRRREWGNNAMSQRLENAVKGHTSMAVAGHCSIPDQTSLEKDNPWLMSKKQDFENNGNKMFQKWGVMVNGWKNEKKKPRDVVGEYDAFKDEWYRRTGIRMIEFNTDREGNPKVYDVPFIDKEDFDDVDFRLWKVLYNKDFKESKKGEEIGSSKTGGKKTLLDHVAPTVYALYENLSYCLPEQEDGYFPDLSELALISHGTFQQSFHSDYPCLVADDNGVLQQTSPTEEEVPIDKWYGSGIYHFINNDLSENYAPHLVIERFEEKFKDEHGTVRKGSKQEGILATQQAWVTFFGAHVIHAGGRNSHPFVRLHFHFDPPSEVTAEDGRKRLAAMVTYVSSAQQLSKDSLRKRAKRREECYRDGFIKTPKHPLQKTEKKDGKGGKGKDNSNQDKD